MTLTISLVTYNGERWLPGLLQSLAAQTSRDFELLALDNASTDASAALLRAAAAGLPHAELIVSDINLGYAAAHNRNIRLADGELMCLLNQDVVLDERFVETVIAASDVHDRGPGRLGAVQARVLRLGADGERTSAIDTTGLRMLRSRRVISRGQGTADGERWSIPGPVWGVDGPVPVYLRAALMDVAEPSTGTADLEFLDEDFFMYKEDVDLAWRLRRRGWRTVYEPDAVAWHARTAAAGDATSLMEVARSNATIDPWIKRVSWRNQRLMQIKNERLTDFLRDAPWILGREIASAGFILAADRERLAAVRDLVRLAPRAIAKRHAITGRGAVTGPD